ncbi:hypothetical protein ACHAPQ_009049 [Fusarium lateritium]
MFAKETQQYGLYRVTGYGDFMLPNRVSYELDLMGPSLVVRTGCSAALVALHEAYLAVSRGDCEGALVGDANLIMAPGIAMAMTEQGVLAPDIYTAIESRVSRTTKFVTCSMPTVNVQTASTLPNFGPPWRLSNLCCCFPARDDVS